MSTELGSAFISVGLGTNKLGPDIKKLFSDSGADAESSGKTIGSKFGGALGIAAAAVGALGIGAFFKSAVSGAGVLEQSVGAIDAVFKGSAGQMHAWSKSAAMDVGLTQNEFNELGTLIGAQLKNGGTAMDELAPKTQNLIGTGADLASMFGGTTSDAVSALSSALKGERDPIEKYGVSLNQAKIDAEAASLGFAKVGGSLSAEASQAATLSLIMKQTADAHGNFASEADTLAGKQQRLNAVWQNGKTELGTALLPAVSAVTGAMLTGLAPAMVGAQVVVRELIGGFTAMGAAFKAGGDDITSSGFAGVMERIGLVARSAFDGIGPIVAALAASFAPLIPQVLSLAAALSPTSLIFQALLPVLPQIAAAIGAVIAAVLPLVVSLTSQLIPIISSLVTAILPPLTAIFTDIVSAILPLVSILLAALIPAIEALLPVVVTVFSFAAELIKNVMQSVQGVIQVVTGIITGDWEKVWTGVGNIFGAVWKNIVTIITGAIAIVGALITMAMSNTSRIIGGALDGIVGFFGGLGGRILGALGNLGGLLLNAGAQILAGFLEGLQAGFREVQNFVGGIGQWIADNKGPKAYDLALLVPAGGWIMEGLGKGIEDSLPSLQRTLGGVSATIAAGVTGANYSPAYTPAIAGAGQSSMSGRMTLMVGGREFDAYLSDSADGRISAADSQSQFMRRGRS